MAASQKTRPLTVRVTLTQYALLNTPKYSRKSSALIRVLLSLFFNGRIKEADQLLAQEVVRAFDAINAHNGFNTVSKVKEKKED
jgi:hypothetical protein